MISVIPSIIAFIEIKTTVAPIKTGQSNLKAALINKTPIPGILNNTSRAATPEKEIGKVTAIVVMKEGRAFLRACL